MWMFTGRNVSCHRWITVSLWLISIQRYKYRYKQRHKYSHWYRWKYRHKCRYKYRHKCRYNKRMFTGAECELSHRWIAVLLWFPAATAFEWNWTITQWHNDVHCALLVTSFNTSCHRWIAEWLWFPSTAFSNWMRILRKVCSAQLGTIVNKIEGKFHSRWIMVCLWFPATQLLHLNPIYPFHLGKVRMHSSRHNRQYWDAVGRRRDAVGCISRFEALSMEPSTLRWTSTRNHWLETGSSAEDIVQIRPLQSFKSWIQFYCRPRWKYPL